MAEHIMNKQMEFFYSENNSYEKLFEELNFRFSFQKVVFLGSTDEVKEKLDEQRKQIKFYVKFCENLDDIDCDIACIVDFDNENIISTRKICTEKNIYYCLCVNSYVDFSALSQIAYLQNEKLQLNAILGAIVDLEKSNNNAENFKQMLCTNMIELCFYAVETRFNKYFFSNEKQDLFEQIISKIEKFCVEFYNNKNDVTFFLNYYFEMISLKMSIDTDILELFSSNDCFCCQNIYYKSVLSEILVSIYSMFLQNISPTLVSIMNSNSLVCYEKFTTFENNFNQEKFWFVNFRYGAKFLCDINRCLKLVKLLKNLSFGLCSDNSFLLARQTDFGFVKQKFKQVAMISENESLLKIMASFGYLDF